MGVLVWRFRQLPGVIQVEGYGTICVECFHGTLCITSRTVEDPHHMAHGQHGKVTWVAVSRADRLLVMFHLTMDGKDLLCTMHHFEPTVGVDFPKRPHA